MGRANVNRVMLVNDSSGGAHNPGYELAGLAAQSKFARSVGGAFNGVYAPSWPVEADDLYAVAANLRNGDGSYAAGAQVEVYRNGYYWPASSTP